MGAQDLRGNPGDLRFRHSSLFLQASYQLQMRLPITNAPCRQRIIQTGQAFSFKYLELIESCPDLKQLLRVFIAVINHARAIGLRDCALRAFGGFNIA